MELEETGDSERTARFVCCIAIIQPGKQAIIKRGTCEGKISKTPEGSHGFGYDPIFVPDGYDQTMAQLTADEKNAISHRRNAIDKVEEWLKELV